MCRVIIRIGNKELDAGEYPYMQAIAFAEKIVSILGNEFEIKEVFEVK